MLPAVWRKLSLVSLLQTEDTRPFMIGLHEINRGSKQPRQQWMWWGHYNEVEDNQPRSQDIEEEGLCQWKSGTVEESGGGMWNVEEKTERGGKA